MKQHLRFFIIGSWILGSRAFDAFSTFQHTPDLSKESNPLASVMGLSWGPLLLVVTTLTLYAVYALAVRTYQPMELHPDEKDFTFSEFIGYVYLGKRAPWTTLFYRFPSSIHRFNTWMGYVMSSCLVYAGILSTLMWLLIQHVPWYRDYHSPALIYSLLIGGCLIILYRWNKNEFIRYQNKNYIR